jgi:hypothetical protein
MVETVPGSENIANVEHLFQRLNAGGTRLDGEELAYSMVKAYWPELEEPVRRIANCRMPEPRLVSLAARVALAGAPKSTNESLPRALSITDFRRLRFDQSKDDERVRVLDFISEGSKPRLEAVLKRVDDWLLYKGPGDCGLPPVLVTSMARSSPDVFLLLMWLANRAAIDRDPGDMHHLRKHILGLATGLHWFGEYRTLAVDTVVKMIQNNPFCKETFQGIMRHLLALDHGRTGVHLPLSPAELEDEIVLPHESELKAWDWWTIVKNDEDKQRRLWPFLDRMINQKELLIYAQLHFMFDRFRDYDPARQDMWEQHDRPWDYDHILASAKIYYKRGVPEAMRSWANCIANLRALRTEENRSDQHVSPRTKIEKRDDLRDSFIADEEFEGFNRGYEWPSRPGDVMTFIHAAKARLVRLYAEWYRTLDIAMLTSAHNHQRTVPGLIEVAQSVSTDPAWSLSGRKEPELLPLPPT